MTECEWKAAIAISQGVSCSSCYFTGKRYFAAMVIATFALAVVLQLPEPDERTARSLLNRSRNVSSEEDVTTIKAELWIDEKGKTRNCELLQFEGSREIAYRMCERVIGAPFVPAKDADGEPIHGLLVETLSVFPQGYQYLSDIQSKALKNELQTVKVTLDLPVGSSQFTVPTFLNLKVLIDEVGQQKNCDPGAASEAKIAELACEHSAQFEHKVRTSRNGVPVPYIRMVTVEFLKEFEQ